MPREKRTRRGSRRRHPGEAPAELATEILELLATRPAGLTTLEIVASLRKPSAEVIRAIADMQRQQWLRSAVAASG